MTHIWSAAGERPALWHMSGMAGPVLVPGVSENPAVRPRAPHREGVAMLWQRQELPAWRADWLTVTRRLTQLDQGRPTRTHVSAVSGGAVALLLDANAAVTPFVLAGEHDSFAVLRHPNSSP